MDETLNIEPITSDGENLSQFSMTSIIVDGIYSSRLNRLNGTGCFASWMAAIKYEIYGPYMSSEVMCVFFDTEVDEKEWLEHGAIRDKKTGKYMDDIAEDRTRGLW